MPKNKINPNGEHNAQPKKKIKKHKEFITFIEDKKFIEAKKLLENNEVDVNQQDGYGQTLLHQIACEKSIEAREIAQILINKDNINQPNRNLWTPLHIAAYAGSLEMVKLLIISGADITPFDYFGQTPLYVAEVAGRTGIVNYLNRVLEFNDKRQERDRKIRAKLTLINNNEAKPNDDESEILFNSSLNHLRQSR